MHTIKAATHIGELVENFPTSSQLFWVGNLGWKLVS